MDPIRKLQYRKILAALSAGTIAFAVFLPALRGEFLNMDDDVYVYDNLFIGSFNLRFLKAAFFEFHACNWHPLTWISHALDYAVWGLDPMGHHLTNNILHAMNTFLVVLLVARLLESWQACKLESLKACKPASSLGPSFTLIAAAVTGLLFGVHPLHVESVAWVSERKDVLCAFFFLLSVLKYMSYRTYKTKTAYSLSLLFFVLALMSKPMAVTLPLVLLILDWYPLNRMPSLSAVRGVVMEKLPFFALSLASAVITILAQRSGGALVALELLPFSTRLLVSIKGLVAYLGKMLLPLDLVPVYPYPQEVSLTSLNFFLPVLLAVIITAAAIAAAKRQRLWPAVWGYYVITLLPVIGLIQVGRQPMADRYTYLPGLGPFVLAGLAAAWHYEKKRINGDRRALRFSGLFVSVVLLAVLAFLSIKQAAVWKDNFTLWNYVIEKEPGKIPSAYNQRGSAFYGKGEYERALDDFSRAIAFEPETYFKAYNNRGMANRQIGRLDMALADFNKAIAIAPEYGNAYNNRGLIFDEKGLLVEAVKDYSRAIALDPEAAAPVYNNRGVAFYKQGMPDKAIEDFSRAIEINPGFDKAYNNRGVAYEGKGLVAGAREDFRKGCELGHKEACENLDGLLRSDSGRII